MARFFAVLVALVACAAVAHSTLQLNYAVNQEFQFSVSGTVDARGHLDSGARTDGSGSTLNGILLTKCTGTNSTGYMFVMNMFNVEVGVNQGPPSAAAAESKPMSAQGGPMGDDMYYWQLKSGEITTVWYNTADSPFYVNVKLSAINAFQTHLVDSAERKLESDPTGTHYSLYHSPKTASYAKSFNQTSYVKFSDPTVHASNVVVSATSYVDTHPTEKHIIRGQVSQMTILSKAATGSFASAESSGDLFESNLSSAGHLTLGLTAGPAAPSGRIGSQPTAQVLASTQYTSGSMHAVATNLIGAMLRLREAEVADNLEQELLKPLNHRVLAFLDSDAVREKLSVMVPDLLEDRVRARYFAAAATAGAGDILAAHMETLREAVLAVHHLVRPSAAVVKKLLKMLPNDRDAMLAAHSYVRAFRNTALSLALQRERFAIPQVASLSSFPFNKTAGGKAKLGGKVIFADFQADVFAGTNFDCNQKNFNYEAQASASCDVGAFGYNKQAFLAQGIYGAQDGSHLADDVIVQFWGKTIYSKNIPSVNCSPHNYPLAHAAPGFNVKYTMWVSIVPITFTAGASLELDLSWGWQVCDTDLSASIYTEPKAGLTFGGGAEINLLLLKAGIDVSASFNSGIIPKVYIHGSECEVGFTGTQVNEPMSAALQAYFSWRKCKFIIFDCHDGKRDQKNWLSWSAPASQHTLWNKSFKIKKLE